MDSIIVAALSPFIRIGDVIGFYRDVVRLPTRFGSLRMQPVHLFILPWIKAFYFRSRPLDWVI